MGEDKTRLVCPVSPVDLSEEEGPCFAAALQYQLSSAGAPGDMWLSRTNQVLITCHEGGSTRAALAALIHVKALPCLQQQQRDEAKQGTAVGVSVGLRCGGQEVTLKAAESCRSHPTSDQSILATSLSRTQGSRLALSHSHS